MRSSLIKFFTFIGGLYFFLEYIIPKELFGFEFGKYNEEITNGFLAISGAAFALGLINLIKVHGSAIARRRPKWSYSLALLLGLVIMLVITSADRYYTESNSNEVKRLNILAEFSLRIIDDAEKKTSEVPSFDFRKQALVNALDRKLTEISSKTSLKPSLQPEKFQEQLLALKTKSETVAKTTTPDRKELTELSDQIRTFSVEYLSFLNANYERSWARISYRLFFDGLFTALGSAMFSLLGFYIAAAAYRAFRIQSFEAALMMVAALIVMLGQISFGALIWDGFTELRLWLLTVPNTAAFRAIEIGATVAGLVMAFRMWLSIESETFGKNK